MTSKGAETKTGRVVGRMLARAARVAGKLLPMRFRAAPWVPALAGVVEDLREMNRLTEGDFLAVGESLLGFVSAARQIRADIGRFSGFLSGEAGERACRALSAVLALSREKQQRVMDTNGALVVLRRTAGDIQRGFSGFNDVVLAFHIVATLGRIETARLGNSQSDLGHLADEVRSCAGKVRDRVEHALRGAVGLGDCLGVGMQHVTELDVQQLQALPSVVGEVERGLEGFRLRQQEANAASLKLAGEFESFSRTIDGLVTALQFHDITRQRIEHVIESLEHLLGTVHPSGWNTGPSPEEIAVMELQCRQLAGASQVFRESVQTVKQSLEEIAIRGRDMDEEAKALLGLTAEDQKSSFYSQMERCLADILAAVSNSTGLDEQTAITAAELERSAAELRTSIRDIREIWLEINRLAINVAIRAVHLGSTGEALSVVAGAMQTVYADADEHSIKTEDSLTSLSRAVLSMAQPQLAPSPVRENGAPVIDELQATIRELELSSQRSLGCGRQISASAATLGAGVRVVSDGFTVGALVDMTIDRCCRTLQRIAGESTSRPVRATGGFQHLAERYTMREEREVHQVAMGAIDPQPSSTNRDGVAAPVPADGFGENVELF